MNAETKRDIVFYIIWFVAWVGLLIAGVVCVIHSIFYSTTVLNSVIFLALGCSWLFFSLALLNASVKELVSKYKRK